MIDPQDLHAATAEIETLLHERLRLRGRTLATRLGRGGRLLPRRARQAGRVLTEAQKRMRHPRLARLIDQAEVARAHAALRRHLRGIDPAERRKTAVLGTLGGLVFNLLLLAAALSALLYWQGVI